MTNLNAAIGTGLCAVRRLRDPNITFVLRDPRDRLGATTSSWGVLIRDAEFAARVSVQWQAAASRGLFVLSE